MLIGIKVEHPIAHIYTQNGLAESFIKRLLLIARPLLMRTKLPVTAWGYTILHAAVLVCLRSTSYNKYSPLQLAFGQELIFPIIEFLDAQYMFQLLHHSWEYMLVINLLL